MSKEIFSKEPQKFNEKLAEALKQIPEFEIPEWMLFVKSGVSKERPSSDDDFWYKRAASILRQLYIKGVVGVNRLRTRYGSKKNRGGKPSKFYKAGGKIIRVILQQAENAGLVEKMDKLQHGRRLTQKGRDLLDSIEVESNTNMNIDELFVENVKVEDSEQGREDENNEEINSGDEDGE